MMTRITICIQSDLLQQITELARRTERGRSAEIRRAIRYWLKRNGIKAGCDSPAGHSPAIQAWAENGIDQT